MYVSCMSYVCLMYMFHLTEANTDEKADSEHGTDCKTEADSVNNETADSGTGEKAEAKANNDEEPKTKKSGAGNKAKKARRLKKKKVRGAIRTHDEKPHSTKRLKLKKRKAVAPPEEDIEAGEPQKTKQANGIHHGVLSIWVS